MFEPHLYYITDFELRKFMKGRKENGQFDLNNDFWKKRILHGNKTDYTPEQLLKAFFSICEMEQ